MILVDANILIYAHDPASPFHQASRDWLERTINGDEEVGFPWLSLWAFLRISTNPRLMTKAGTVEDVFNAAGELLAHPNVHVVQPGPRHLPLLRFMVEKGQSPGPRVTDASLAAMAAEEGASVASTDRDFGRFPGLKWTNPLDA